MSAEFKNRMYDYEVAPPKGVWQAIEAELGHGAKVITMEKRSSFFYSMVAAAVTLFLFVSIAFSIQQGGDNNKMNATAQSSFNATASSYVVMCTTDGKEVTVSSKVAPMIVSQNEPALKNPRRPEWSKKMKKWQSKMMTASTTNFLDVMNVAVND
jgi:hypothetical protein